MRFSSNTDERHEQAREVLAQCQEDRMTRASHYKTWNAIYDRGAYVGIEVKDNRIKPIVDQQSSFLYAPESISFWVDLGVSALANWVDVPPHVIDQLSQVSNLSQFSEDKLEQVLEQINFDRIEAVIDAMNDSWHDTDIDTDSGNAVTDALKEGCAIIKLMVEPHRAVRRNSIIAYQINPADFGVYRPDEPHLNRQQAFAHTTTLSKPEILLRIWQHPRRSEILAGLEPADNQGVTGTRLFPTSATSTSVTGAPIGVFTGQFDYTPRHGAPLFRVHELYCWDDLANDYRIFQIAGNHVILENFLGGVVGDDGRLLRLGMGIKGRPPFVKICPYPKRNYFWGWSLVDGLTPLQNWYTARLNQLDAMFAKSLNKPKVVQGMGGLDDEIRESLNTEGGTAFLGQPGATVNELSGDVPPQALEILSSIQNTFYEFSSMRPSLFGKQEPGTRSEGMLSGLLRVAAAPTRKTALIIEKQMEELASLLFLYKREFQDDELPGKDGVPFYLREFPEDARIRVDGHSGCPLFSEDHMKMAESMWRMGVLTPSVAVDLIHPPMSGYIKFSQRKIEMAKMIAAQVVKQRQEEKRTGKDKS